MEILNYGITQNTDVPLCESFEDLPTNDLNLYEQMGNYAMEEGSLEQGISWYEKGFNKAAEIKDLVKMQYFESLIFTCL